MKKGEIVNSMISSAIIWGAVMVGCALKLKGTQYYAAISPILIGGAGIHLLFIWGPLERMLKKKEENQETDQTDS